MATKKELLDATVEAYKTLLGAGANNTIRTSHVKMIISIYENEIVNRLIIGDIVLVGYGTLYAYRSKPKNGRNPRNGATIAIPAKNRLNIKMSKMIEDFMNP